MSIDIEENRKVSIGVDISADQTELHPSDSTAADECVPLVGNMASRNAPSSVGVGGPRNAAAVENREHLLLHINISPTVDGRMETEPTRLEFFIRCLGSFLILELLLLCHLSKLLVNTLTTRHSTIVLEVWCVAWLLRLIAQNGINLTILVFRKRGSSPPRVIFFAQVFSFLFGLGWYLYGTVILWFDKSSTFNEVTLFWARLFWWYQSLTFLFPCAIYSLLCMCLPCIILAMIRLQVPYRDQQPTPDDVLTRFEVKTYESLVSRLRSEQRPQSREDSGPQDTALVGDLPSVEQLAVVPGGVTLVENLNVALGFSSPAAPAAGNWNKVCPICMLDLEGSDEVMVMPCDQRHFFHKGCVSRWLRNSQVCPICRANVVSIITETNSAECV